MKDKVKIMLWFSDVKRYCSIKWDSYDHACQFAKNSNHACKIVAMVNGNENYIKWVHGKNYVHQFA